MSDNPFAKYAPAAGADDANPFAKYKVAGSSEPAPASSSGPPSPPSPESGQIEAAVRIASDFPKSVANPLVNFLDYPLRAVGADIYGAATGGLPIDAPRREKFYAQREKALDATTLPESDTGKALSEALGYPGQAVGAGVKHAAESLLGPEKTERLGPLATVLGDAAPLAMGGAAAVRRGTVGNPYAPSPEAAAAHKAGYRLAPEEIGEQSSTTARLLSGLSGKYKKQQAFSEHNQTNTNRLAAQAIGLPPETRLSPAAIERARQPAIAAYDAIKTEIPETALAADPTFRQAVERVGVRNETVEKFFPEAAHDPRIAELRHNLLRNDVASTDAVMKKIADLRFESSRNFRKREDAQAHALGYAQRQAADVLEDAIERSIGYGTDRVSAFARHGAATKELAAARDVLNGKSTRMTKGAPLAQTELDAATQDLTQRLATITPAEIARAQTLGESYRTARALFAKTYDLELATNRATGDVLARRVATLRSASKKPLTGELKQIADAADAFPKEMQMPGAFGHLEDWSVLDIVGAGTAVAAGHPVAGMVIAGRHPARSILTSPWYQNRMFERQPFLTRPGRAAVGGEVAQPHGPLDEDDPTARALGYTP